MTSDKYLKIIEETIGGRKSETRIPLRQVFTNFLLDASNSTNNDELFHIECLFNTQKEFYSKIQLAVHAGNTMKDLKSPLKRELKPETYQIERNHTYRKDTLANKCVALNEFKINPVISLEEGQSTNSPTKRLSIMAVSAATQ